MLSIPNGNVSHPIGTDNTNHPTGADNTNGVCIRGDGALANIGHPVQSDQG